MVMAAAIAVALPATAAAALANPAFTGEDDLQWWTAVPKVTPQAGGSGTITCSLVRNENVPTGGQAGTNVWSGSGASSCGGSATDKEPRLPTLADGWYRFAYSVINASGKATATFSFGLDRVAPTAATFTYHTTFPTVDPAFDFTASDSRSGISRYTCRVTAVGDVPDPNGWNECSPPQTLGWDPAISIAGDHTFEVRPEDQAGNQAASATSVRFTQVSDAPVASAGPSLSYSPWLAPGSTLSLSGYGTWPTIDFWDSFASGPVGAPFEFTVEWFRCDATAANCAMVPLDAEWTATNPLEYQLTQADVGKRIKAIVTLGFCDTEDPAACDLPMAPPVTSELVRLPPSSTSQPTLAGGAKVGGLLTAAPGAWTGAIGQASRAWERCTSASAGCSAIAGQTGATYSPGPADVGKYFRVTETAIGVGGRSTRSSSPVGPITWPSPSNTTPPVITGTAAVGNQLTAAQGTWGNATTVTRKWERCTYPSSGCTAISGQTGSTYTLVTADRNMFVRVTEMASGPGGQTTASGIATGRVLSSPPTSLASPTLAGSAAVGAIITLKAGKWSDGTVTRVWERCTTASAGCTVIPGQTGTTYSPAPADMGKYVRVTETAIGSGGTTSASSVAAGPVALPALPSLVAPPTLSGGKTEGMKLTARPGTWTSGNVSATWMRCTSVGLGCTPIAGTAGYSYTLTSADRGRWVRIRETSANATGSVSGVSAAVGPIVGKTR